MRTILLAAALLCLNLAAAGETWLPSEWIGTYAEAGKSGGALRMTLTGCGYMGERLCGEMLMTAGDDTERVDFIKVDRQGDTLIIYGTGRTGAVVFSGDVKDGVWSGTFPSGTFRLSAVVKPAGVRRMPGEDINASWIYDSTLDMPFAMAALPNHHGFLSEGNVAWAHMPPVLMYAAWIRVVSPGARIIVEMAVPVAAHRGARDGSYDPTRRDAADVLRAFVQPILAKLAPDAEIGEIRDSPDSPLLEMTRLDLAESEAPFLAAGREIRDARADAAEMTVTSGDLRTRFSVAAWSFLHEREGGGFSTFGKWTGLLCVTAPAKWDVPEEMLRELVGRVYINPLWRDRAEEKLTELLMIEESPPFDIREEKARWDAMNRSGRVLVPLPDTRCPEAMRNEYVPPPPPDKRAVMMPNNRYTYVNAVLDGCFLGFKATAEAVDIENVNPLALFPEKGKP